MVIRNTLISQNLETSKFWNRKILKAFVTIHSNCRPAAVTITKPFAVSAAGSNNDKKYNTKPYYIENGNTTFIL